MLVGPPGDRSGRRFFRLSIGPQLFTKLRANGAVRKTLSGYKYTALQMKYKFLVYEKI